ncbi:MAG: alpha/beta hydrolase [Chloroflexi bacterium]|nr:alpha/beta hydrolase [Chloroflexota bacterium]
MTTATAPTTSTLRASGATLTYDVRPVEGSTHRPLMLIGSPMGAAGFGTLASHFTDRTVITYDPRGVERSTKDDPTTESTPEQHADDLHRVIEAAGLGQVDLFASSGGAINALALVAAHPTDVRSLVAHEPPLAALVPDRETALAVCRAVANTYQQRGFGAGMAHFISVVMHQGPFTDEIAAQPGPDPQMFGMPADDDGTRTDPLLAQNMVTSTAYEPDIEALRAAPTTIVIAVGAESGGALARRGGEAVAALLGQPPVEFPSDHGGFLGGEYGQTGDPDAFAPKLREVLDAA